MKKTLIALAVAASAVVSGSAMAAGWEQNGSGGSVDLGGTLTPVEKTTPWEVKVGDAVSGLDAQIQKGQKEVSIAVNKAIPVLGIRTQTNDVIIGASGKVSPQIDYHGALNIDQFKNGVAPVTLVVKDETGTTNIGRLTADFTAVGVISWKRADGIGAANNAIGMHGADMFRGGLGKTEDSVSNHSVNIANKLIPGVGDKFNNQGFKVEGKDFAGLNVKGSTYSGYYASGIEQGKTIKISLDTPAAGNDPIVWKASLPVTVTYQ
ncbi:hypothetical protein MO113_001245 [Escherichia coli]|nr:hypothetical protein [Escherichia coli]